MSAPKIILEKAKEAPIPFSGEVEMTPEALGGGPVLAVSPLSMAGEISSIDGEYFVRATESFSADLECSRCLKPFPETFSAPVELRLHRRPEAQRAAPSPAVETRRGARTEPEREDDAEDELLDRADLDVFFYAEPYFPFEEIALEQAIMAIPMKPLCRPDCRGLCPVCGLDRNTGTCTCQTRMEDPRLAVLKNLR